MRRTVVEGRIIKSKRLIGSSEDLSGEGFHAISEGPWTVGIGQGPFSAERILYVNLNNGESLQRYSMPLAHPPLSERIQIPYSDFMELGQEILDMLTTSSTDHINGDLSLSIHLILNSWLIRKDFQ
jgi:hypothetical protein